MKNLIRAILAAVAVIGLATYAFAGVDTPEMPTIEGLGIFAETGVDITAGDGFVGLPIFWESDDSGPYTGPTGAVIDTGAEACAVFGLSCAETYTFAVGGASGDEFTDVTCTTDQADGVISMSFCF